MKLATDLPDTPVLRELMQLLHEEIGLPEHKTVSLKTAINLDLGCNGRDAQQLMEALEERFTLEDKLIALVLDNDLKASNEENIARPA